jgi:hypothetical protein
LGHHGLAAKVLGTHEKTGWMRPAMGLFRVWAGQPRRDSESMPFFRIARATESRIDGDPTIPEVSKPEILW